MQVTFLITMFILGACFGSFLCCQARRLHLKQSKKGTKKLGSRSVCLHCKYQLKWYDNIPIFSWLLLRGKCRKCHKKIGLAEIFSELGLGLAFILPAIGFSLKFENLLVYPMEFVMYGIYLLLIVVLVFLAIYDGLYGELPIPYLITSIIIASAIVTARIISDASPSALPATLGDLVLSVVILSGLYLILYKISGGRWIGDGDWLLGLTLALTLGSPWLSLITLFVANLLACLIMLPILRKQKRAKIYLGPFLITAFVIVTTFQNFFMTLL